jgi:FkbM family methyltransferase
MRSTFRLLARTGLEPSTIADVGAADGGWSRLARSNFPSAELVLFEPHPAHAAALDRFKIENPDATIVHSAVGAARGTSPFDARDPWGGVLQKEKNAGSMTVSVVTLDDALAATTPPFLVKLDTHGIEADIFAGAQQTLGRSVAWIVEAYNYRITPDCLLFWDLCGYMEAHGFRPIDLVDVIHRPHDNTLWQMDLIFIRSDWAGFDYLGYT